MLCTFSLSCFQIYQNKCTKNIGVQFIGTIVPIKCMLKISAVELFFLDKFENNQTRTCSTFFRTSKLTEVYFSPGSLFFNLCVLFELLIFTLWKSRKKCPGRQIDSKVDVDGRNNLPQMHPGKIGS